MKHYLFFLSAMLFTLQLMAQENQKLNAEVVQRQLEAYNQRNIEAFMGHFPSTDIGVDGGG